MGLFALIKEDFETVRRNDPAMRSCVELFFNYPGLGHSSFTGSHTDFMPRG